MKNIVSIVTLLFIVSFSVAEAGYYAQDYDPDYLPYNFQDAADADFDGCNLVLHQYDDISDKIDRLINIQKTGNSSTNRDNYVIPWTERPYVNDVRVGSFSELKTVTEEEIRLCMIDYREYEELEKQEAEAQAKKEAQLRWDIKYQKDIDEALENCDFDYFGNMSNEEKMKTYDGRKACEEKANEPVVVTPTYVSPVVVEPVSVSYVPTPLLPVQVMKIPAEEEENVVEEVVSTTTEATTTEEVISVTQEELDRMVEEKLNEKLGEVQSEPESTPEPKLSFFKKVANFLFGWMF